ncbi:hypothetical protein M434DRAFT_36521 [Hypoxylon sp. CO27-5]|nr:hypothetical protein M434DRAFT_36521 [Hypoxylon sp. CO27-5]
MANLDTLPSELLANITNYYSGLPATYRTLGQKDLANLALVNRRLYQVIMPVLYDYNIRFYDFSAPFIAVDNKNLDTLKVIKSLNLALEWEVLWRACEHDRYEIIEWLLDNMPVTPDGDEDSKTKYALAIRAAFEGDATEDTILLLLPRASIPHILQIPQSYHDFEYTSALHYAAKKNMFRAVDYLVCEMGISVDVPDTDGLTPLFESLDHEPEAETNQQDLIPIIALQLQERAEQGLAGVDDEMENDKNRDLRNYNDVRMLKKLMEFGADINIEFNGKLPLTVALERFRYNHAHILISAGAKLTPSQPRPGILSPIRTCIIGWTWVEYWMDRDWRLGWRFNWERDYDGVKLVASAQARMFQRLVEAGANINERQEPGTMPVPYARPGDTLLELAIMRSPTKLVSQLLAMGASLSTETADADIALMDTAMDFIVSRLPGVYFAKQKMELFLKNGARMDVTLPRVGESLLMWASRFKWFSISVVDSLLDIATPSTLSREHLDEVFLRCLEEERDYTAYNSFIHHGAAVKDFDRVSSALIKWMDRASSSDKDRHDGYWFSAILDMGFPKDKLNDLLTVALRKKNKVKAHALLNHMEPDLSNQHRNWLHEAASQQDLAIMQRLIRRGMDVNLLSNKSRTPMRNAILRHNHQAVRVLLNYGANPFLPANRPLCHGEGDINEIRSIQGVSAFELAIHRSEELEIIKEMWQMTAPDARPELSTFVSCVPHEYPELAKWLLSQGKEDIDVGVTL